MNSWANLQPGYAQKFEGGMWAIHRITFSPTETVRKQGGQIWFKEITGAAEVWIDGKLVSKKEPTAPAELKVSFPPGDSHTISVLINSGGAPTAGLSGSVIIARGDGPHGQVLRLSSEGL